MQVNTVTRQEFLDLVYNDQENFMRMINDPQAFAVKGFYDSDRITDFRNTVFASGQQSEPSWHPLFNDCPDYHRLHDNYPKAYVKAKMHAFYFHPWYEKNKPIFEFFDDIFKIKNHLGGHEPNEFMGNIPSDGYIARVNVHHYPRGGGYQAEHIDPKGKHAEIQTLVIGGQFGEDYNQGGVYAREKVGAPRTYFDPHVGPGDMLVLSPGIPHGVDVIDPDAGEYGWQSNSGRWMILPIIVASDYPNPAASKPFQVTEQA